MGTLLGVGNFQLPAAPPNWWLQTLSHLWGENVAFSLALGDGDLWLRDIC